MAITFTSEGVRFDLRGRRQLRVWIEQVIHHANKKVGEVAYVFCDDERLLTVNRQFLNHDTYTDIITFDYVLGDVVSGDIMISVDRVRENALQLGRPFSEELHRVMIHGVLHLLGQGDKSEDEGREMRAKEDASLQLLSMV